MQCTRLNCGRSIVMATLYTVFTKTDKEIDRGVQAVTSLFLKEIKFHRLWCYLQNSYGKRKHILFFGVDLHHIYMTKKTGGYFEVKRINPERGEKMGSASERGI